MSKLTPVDVSTARRIHHPAQFVIAAFVLAISATIAWIFVTNPTVDWGVITHYLFVPAILEGVWITLVLTVVCMAIGVVLGILLAAARMSRMRAIKMPADFYVWFFRGTPTLVQLIFWYNIAIFIPRVTIGLPGQEPWIDENMNDVIPPLGAAILGLGLNAAAYMSEIVRGGLLSVPNGQREAAQSLGLPSSKAFTQIILPQAMRAIVPPTGNQTIIMLKSTALVSTMAVADLFYSAQGIYVTNGEVISLLVVASAWYLFLTTVLYFFQGRVEKRFGRGFVRRSTKSKPAQTVITAGTSAEPATAKTPVTIDEGGTR